jgi:hypothetical protein
VSSYSANAHASINLHVMEDVPVKAKITRNFETQTLVIDAGSSTVALFFWGPEAPAKLAAIRDAIDAAVAVPAE